MALVFCLVNLFFGLMLMLPFRAALDRFVGFSLMGSSLAGRLDMDFLFEFLTHNRTAVAAVRWPILGVAAIYWLFHLFLSGGALAVFATREGYKPALFWGSAAKYFGRFLRLMLWSLLVLIVLISLPLLEVVFRQLVFGDDPYQYVSYWGNWVRVGLAAIGLLLYGLVIDYARIHCVLIDSRKMQESLWRGLTFAFRNLARTIGLALSFLIIVTLTLLAYNFLADSLAAPKVYVIVILFVVQQFYIFLSMVFRLARYSGEMHLYEQLAN